jgi:hypothetical protein
MMKKLLLAILLLAGCAGKAQLTPEQEKTINNQGELVRAIAVYLAECQKRGILPSEFKDNEVKKK